MKASSTGTCKEYWPGDGEGKSPQTVGCKRRGGGEVRGGRRGEGEPRVGWEGDGRGGRGRVCAQSPAVSAIDV